MKYKLSILSSVIGAALVSGCGFESEQNVSEVTVTPLQGKFLDSGVGGIQFRRTNINGEVTEGVTNSDGSYEYVRGESIEFYVGDVTFPAVQAKSIITPLSFFSTNNPNAENVANLARFLQSLDTDNDPSNGITIDNALASVAKFNTDSEGNPLTAKAFFNQSGAEFATAVETWLAQATNNTRTSLVSYEDAVSHFVSTLAAELGEYKAQAFKLDTLSGPITHIYVENGAVITNVLTLTPEDSADNTATKGTYTISQDDVEIGSGLYELSNSRQVLILNKTDDSQTVVDKQYLVSLASSSEGGLYSVCDAASAAGLQTLINDCETADNRKANKLILNADLVADEVTAMQEYAASIDQPEPALFEEFEVDSVNTFYSSTYKRLAESTSSGPLYFKTGGTIEIENGQLKLAGDRFSIGNAEPEVSTTSADTKGTGIYNLSEGFTISFDVIDHNGSGGLSLYVDNNTTSAGNSLHGSASKFVGSSINDENFPKGQRFSFTHEGFPLTTNSFFQLRTDSAGSITIDNLKIETVAGAVVKEAYEPVVFSCSNMSDLYFCDDFSQGNLDNWDLFASDGNTSGPEGVFDILSAKGDNNVMRYTAGGLGGVLATVKDSVMANVPDADYYVEAKLRPRQNGTTANKHLYMLGRYVDQQNWYAGGLNLQNSSSSTQAEVATLIADSLSRPVQKKQPFILGERDATEDGIWYTVRFEMLGSDLTLYINGEKKGTYADSNFTAKGLAGLYTFNRSFELDDFKIGAATNKPIQISTDLTESTLVGGVNGTPLTFNVSAILGDGSADSVTVHSGDGDIAKATIDGAVVTVNPLEEGMTTIYLVSATDPTVMQKIDITVAPQFIDSTTDYGDLSAKLSPAINEMSAYTDTLISLEFDSAPTLGENGMVRIYDANTNTLVDELKVAGDLDTIKSERDDKFRSLRYQAIYVEGNKLVIKPHSGVLAYGTEYYVVIGNDVALNTQLNGLDFDGLGSSTMWSFTTKSTQPTGTSILVDDDGMTADFRTLQAAMAYAMKDKDAATTISIRDGVYNELLYLRDKNNLTIQGESRDGTIVQYNNYEGLNGGSSGRPVFLVESADMLVLNNFTLKNTHERSGSGDQAETIYFNSPGKRMIANNMNFVSEQDTLQLKGYTWFYNSLVAGNVDFIWGYPEAALFENTEIRTVGRSEKAPADSEGGYVLQARVQDADKDNAGFVFLNSEFTSGAGPRGNGVLDNSTYIARSGGSSNYYDNVLLINNKMGPHIINEGWATPSNTDQKQPAPNPSTATATMGWREFGSMDLNGNALDLTGRDPMAAVLTSAPFSDRAGVFANFNAGAGWDPQPIDAPDFTNLPTDGNDGNNGGDGSVIANPAAGDGGFAGDSYTLTGGEGGTAVTVATGTALVAALDAAKNAGTPTIIYIDGTITAANTGNTNRNIGIKDLKNITIEGVADRGEFNGIGLQIERAENIIIRNLKMHEVPKDFGDVIGIEGDATVGTSRIWIDHNELYGSLAVDKDHYDGLIDSKAGASHITISYNYIHDHWKTMLNGSSDDDAGERYITYHHNHFANINSRVPLFRYGYGHLYNNYFVNINGSAINSRMGAQLLIENNVFEDVKNPIVSMDSREVGYWYARGNSFEGSITYSDNDTFGSTEDSYSISGAITGTYDDVSYDYAAHLLAVTDVKAHVKAHAGVGKITQADDIPAVDNGNNGGSDNGSNTGNTGTPNLATAYVESFSATDADAFFTSAYRDIDGANDGSKDAMYRIATGGSRIFVKDGALEMTGARFSVGNTVDTDTSDADTATTGVLDLSAAYTVSFKVVNVGGTTTKGFQIYVDNNTSSSGKSIHGSASKFYSAVLDDLVVGQTYTVDGLVATSTSFITLRTETDATITIDDLKIEKKVVELANSGSVDLATPYVEVFSATDATEFFTPAYRDITGVANADATNAAMYSIATGGSRIFVKDGALEMTGARFSIGNTVDTDTSDADTTTTGVLDLSADYTVSFKVVSVGGTTTKGFQIYVDNNTSSSGKSIHGSASKFYSAVLDDLVVGETYTVDGLTATSTSFITLRTETDATITLDNLVISKK